MLKFVSRVVSLVITLGLSIFLYPIAAFFYITGWLLKLIGYISEAALAIARWIFEHANKAISEMWDDIT